MIQFIAFLLVVVGGAAIHRVIMSPEFLPVEAACGGLLVGVGIGLFWWRVTL